MQSELPIECPDLCGLDELRMADQHAVQRAIESLPPKPKKLEQYRKFWREIVILPDVGLQEARVVGQMIEDPRRGKPLAGELLDKIGGYDLCFDFFRPVIVKPPRRDAGKAR
jgi:hypothetical protein